MISVCKTTCFTNLLTYFFLSFTFSQYLPNVIITFLHVFSMLKYLNHKAHARQQGVSVFLTSQFLLFHSFHFIKHYKSFTREILQKLKTELTEISQEFSSDWFEELFSSTFQIIDGKRFALFNFQVSITLLLYSVLLMHLKFIFY